MIEGSVTPQGRQNAQAARHERADHARDNQQHRRIDDPLANVGTDCLPVHQRMAEMAKQQRVQPAPIVGKEATIDVQRLLERAHLRRRRVAPQDRVRRVTRQHARGKEHDERDHEQREHTARQPTRDKRSDRVTLARRWAILGAAVTTLFTASTCGSLDPGAGEVELVERKAADAGHESVH